MEVASSLRVALYLRTSTQEQSTALQLDELQAFVAARGWKNVTVYEDQASGTNSNRPQLKHLLADARQRKVDVIACWKLDRLARSLKDLLNMLQEFNELGIAFVSLKDNIDLTTSTGRLMVAIIGAFAQFEADIIRERVRAGLKAAKARGKRLGRPKLYDDNKIRALRQQGLSYTQIQKQLNAPKGVVCRALRSTPKTLSS